MWVQYLMAEDTKVKRARLAELLSKLSEFRVSSTPMSFPSTQTCTHQIHTGNINQWAALKQKRFENSAEVSALTSIL